MPLGLWLCPALKKKKKVGKIPSFSHLGEGDVWPGPFSTWMHTSQRSAGFDAMMFGDRLLSGKSGIHATAAQLLPSICCLGARANLAPAASCFGGRFIPTNSRG